MIPTNATLPCSDAARPRLPMDASLERGLAFVPTAPRGTGLPAFRPLGERGTGVTGDVPTFATKQAPAVGSRAWSPPV
jgi:hypothetical protein